MTNETLKLAEDETAKNEPPIKPCDLLEEILPLMEEYFIGQIAFDGKRITYVLPNGQTFAVSASETA